MRKAFTNAYLLVYQKRKQVPAKSSLRFLLKYLLSKIIVPSYVLSPPRALLSIPAFVFSDRRS